VTAPQDPDGPPRAWKLEPARDHGLPLMQRLRSLRRENGLVESVLHIAWWGFVRGYMAAWHRLRVVGRQNLPASPPFVLVANHSSHLDALVLASPLPWMLRDRVFPIAAGDTFFESPLSSAFAAFLLNALPLWRKKAGAHALTELRQRLLSERCAYILFPEGTRSRDGRMTAFKPGLGMLVAGTDVPVIPCRLDGTWAALPPKRKVPRPRSITIRVGEPLLFTGTPDERSGWVEIAARAEEAVRKLEVG
jgi:1-acyl-sn-glycerol-3-phosphate acyltransferase